MQAVGRPHMPCDQGMERLQRAGGIDDEIGQGGQAELESSRAKHSPSRFRGWCWPNFSKATIAMRPGPAQPRGSAWKGAGGWLIFLQFRQVNFPTPLSDHLPLKGITSSVSVMSSPNFTIRGDPQQVKVGSRNHHALARQMFGKRLARRLRRSKARTGVGCATPSARSASSVAAASSSSSWLSCCSISRALRSEI